MYDSITIAGNLGKDPEMRYMPDGNPVTSFSVATNKTWKDSNGQQHKQVKWFRVSAFGKLAEITNTYLKKGSKVLVVGELQADKETGSPRIYKTQNGTSAASFEIKAETVRFLSSQTDQERDETPIGYDSSPMEIPF